MGRDIETDPDADADWDADADADQYGCWPNEWQRWRIRNTVPKGSPDPNAQKSRQGKLAKTFVKCVAVFRPLSFFSQASRAPDGHVPCPKSQVPCRMSHVLAAVLGATNVCNCVGFSAIFHSSVFRGYMLFKHILSSLREKSCRINIMSWILFANDLG